MAGKKFEFRVDGNGKIVIKEVIKRGSSVRGPKHSISFCLTSDFELANRYIMKDNIAVIADNTSKVKKDKRDKPIYFDMSEISCIVTVTYQCNRQGKVVDKTLAIYEPISHCSDKDLYCQRITAGLSIDARNELVEKLTPYCLQRLGLKK